MFDVLHANRLHTFASHCRCSEAHNIVHVMAIRSLEKAKLGQTKSFKLAMWACRPSKPPQCGTGYPPRCFSTGTARCEVYPYSMNIR
jgi:hypothetical protein